ncbi:MAG: hypothetical protein V4454_08205 [Pseudomonadota bacterium]
MKKPVITTSSTITVCTVKAAAGSATHAIAQAHSVSSMPVIHLLNARLN